MGREAGLENSGGPINLFTIIHAWDTEIVSHKDSPQYYSKIRQLWKTSTIASFLKTYLDSCGNSQKQFKYN